MPFGVASTKRKFSQPQSCWPRTALPAQEKPPLRPSPSAVRVENTGPRSIPVTVEQEKHRRVRVDVASILQEALKDYQVAAQTLARFTVEKLLCEDRQLHCKQLKCLHREPGGQCPNAQSLLVTAADTAPP